jgi:hypothetical protein
LQLVALLDAKDDLATMIFDAETSNLLLSFTKAEFSKYANKIQELSAEEWDQYHTSCNLA